MAYRKKTLRAMPVTSKKVAKAITELESITRRLKKLLPVIQEYEKVAAPILDEMEEKAVKHRKNKDFKVCIKDAI